MKLSYRFLGGLSAWIFAASMAVAADPPVSGKFTGNGKEAKLAFVTALKGEPYDDKPTIKFVFTEKDHSKDKKPDFNAAFGRFGSALIITVKPDGKIIGCEVAHTAHEKGTFSSLGSIAMSDYKVADGKITGKIKTDGELDTFKQKWLVDIKFEVKAP
jgi:hypothetical protein